jgi:hypothetical protein
VTVWCGHCKHYEAQKDDWNHSVVDTVKNLYVNGRQCFSKISSHGLNFIWKSGEILEQISCRYSVSKISKLKVNVYSFIPAFIQSFNFYAQNVTIRCRSQELLPFLSIINILFSATLLHQPSSILSHFILPFISWSTSWSCWFLIQIQYSFGNYISSILCTCLNQRNLWSLIVYVIVGILTVV